MKAAVLTKFNPEGTFEIWDDVDIAAPVGREVLFDVKASGLCHSDLHLAAANYGYGEPPMILGHEAAGVVTAVGPQVREFAVGDHVVGSLIQSCGHCLQCLTGKGYICSNGAELMRADRLTRDGTPIGQTYGLGGFAEQALVHENQLVKVDERVPFSRACLLGCGVITGAGAAINTAHVRPGDSVAVIGTGGVGLNAISGARIAGASRIIAVDLQDDKLEMAKRFGATDGVNSSTGDPVDQVRQLTGGGVDHAFEVIGLVPTSRQAVNMAKRGGHAYLIGVHKPTSVLELNVMAELLGGSRTVEGVYMGSTIIKHDIPMYADLYLQGRMNLDDLVSQEIALADINDAYAALRTGGVVARSVITSF